MHEITVPSAASPNVEEPTIAALTKKTAAGESDGRCHRLSSAYRPAKPFVAGQALVAATGLLVTRPITSRDVCDEQFPLTLERWAGVGGCFVAAVHDMRALGGRLRRSAAGTLPPGGRVRDHSLTLR